MKKTQIQNYQMFTRVVEFTTNNVNLFPQTSAVAEILASLQSTVNAMSKQASAQAASEGTLRDIRTARAAARDSLIRRLVLTEQVARAFNSDKFAMPAKRRDHDLIAAGHGFVENGASLADEFRKHALPLNELTAAVEALERANSGYASGKAARAAAIREFGCSTIAAAGYVQRLEAIVQMTLSENPAALASWATARTVQRTAGRKREVQPADSVAPEAPSPPAKSVPLAASAAA